MRELEEIYLAMREAFAQRAGFAPNDGCDAAARLYALAAQVQSLEAQTDWVLAQSFPQTAQGEFLDYHAAMRALTRNAPVCAEGTLRFAAQGSAAADYAIPAGTVCMTAAGARFETAEDAVLCEGESAVDVPARACEAGAAGNVVAGAVSAGAALPPGIVYCSNPAAFTGGCDAESDEALRARILESYRRLPNGANAAFYEREAMSVAGVAAAKAVGRARGIGTVDLYIAAAGGSPSEVMLDAVREALEGKREIAVDLRVLAPEEEKVSINAAIEVKQGYDFDEVADRVREALRACFDGTLLGEGMPMARITAAIFAVEGVKNCHLLAPTCDIDADERYLPVLQSCRITRMG